MAFRADSRIDDDEGDALREVLDRPRQRECGVPQVAGWDLVGDVDDPRLRCELCQHTMHNADKLVLVAEIGEKADRKAHWARR